MFLFEINGVLYLGFLKFLKRDKRKEPDLDLKNLGDLDVPPLPPDFKEKGLGERELPELPELPELEGEEPISEMEEKPLSELEPSEKQTEKLEFPSMEGPKLGEGIGTKIPTMPEFPKAKEATKAPDLLLPKPLFGMQKPRPFFGAGKPQEERPEVKIPPRPVSEIKPYERFEKAAVREERSILKHKEAEGPTFIRIERFRNILAETREIKNNLKISGQSIVKLNEIDADKDKVLERWHNVMIDLQKKLIFIDKILFKGR
jgi:hypothetical protein